MESVRYTELYLTGPITTNQSNLANDVLKLCPYCDRDVELVGSNVTHSHMNNLQGAIMRTDFIVENEKFTKHFQVLASYGSAEDRMQ